MKTEHELLIELGRELLKVRQALHDLQGATGLLQESEASRVLDSLLCKKHVWLKGLMAVTCPQCIVDEAYRRGYYKAPPEATWQ